LAALDLGPGVEQPEQPFDCLIVQNRQAMQSMRGSVDWTLEDRGVHTPFVQAGAGKSDTGAEAVKAG